jgi:hypothetical protein
MPPPEGHASVAAVTPTVVANTNSRARDMRVVA